MFMCISWFGLIVSACHVIGYPLRTPIYGKEIIKEIISIKPRLKRMFVFFHFAVKIPLNTNQPNQTNLNFPTPFTAMLISGVFEA